MWNLKLQHVIENSSSNLTNLFWGRETNQFLVVHANLTCLSVFFRLFAKKTSKTRNSFQIKPVLLCLIIFNFYLKFYLTNYSNAIKRHTENQKFIISKENWVETGFFQRWWKIIFLIPGQLRHVGARNLFWSIFFLYLSLVKTVVSIGWNSCFLSWFSSTGVYSDYTSAFYIHHCLVTKGKENHRCLH